MKHQEEIIKILNRLTELNKEIQDQMEGFYGLDLPIERKVDARLSSLSMGFELSYLRELLKDEGNGVA